MENKKLVSLSSEHYYVTDSKFRVGLGKQESPLTQLGILFTIHNAKDADIREADWDDIIILASIVLHNEECPSEMCYSEYGGVDCNGILSSSAMVKYAAALPLVHDEDSYDEEKKVPAITFVDVRRNNTLPCMRDNVDLLEGFLKEVIAQEFDGLSITVGFFLDNCVNMIGNTGWDLLEMQRKPEKDLIASQIKKLIKER